MKTMLASVLVFILATVASAQDFAKQRLEKSPSSGSKNRRATMSG